MGWIIPLYTVNNTTGNWTATDNDISMQCWPRLQDCSIENLRLPDIQFLAHKYKIKMLMGISLSTRRDLVTIHDVTWFDLGDIDVYKNKQGLSRDIGRLGFPRGT